MRGGLISPQRRGGAEGHAEKGFGERAEGAEALVRLRHVAFMVGRQAWLARRALLACVGREAYTTGAN